jgi:hypothetical protein
MNPMGMGMPDPSMMGMDPMMDPMMGGGMDPSMDQAPPMSEDEAIIQLMQALLGKWGQDEAQLAGEKSGLLETMMMMLGAAPPAPADAMAEGGMMGMPEDDIPGMY